MAVGRGVAALKTTRLRARAQRTRRRPDRAFRALLAADGTGPLRRPPTGPLARPHTAARLDSLLVSAKRRLLGARSSGVTTTQHRGQQPAQARARGRRAARTQPLGGGRTRLQVRLLEGAGTPGLQPLPAGDRTRGGGSVSARSRAAGRAPETTGLTPGKTPQGAERPGICDPARVGRACKTPWGRRAGAPFENLGRL